MKIQDSVMIVTGASSGIGAATARELARRGARVVLAARRESQLVAVAREIERTGGQALVVPTDVTRREDIDRLVQTTLNSYGQIDVLVNNAGINAGARIGDSDDAAIEQIVNVNLLAPSRCIQAVLPAMREQHRGVIINIGSVAGEVATSGLYAGTKFGLRGLSDGLRRELRHEGIAVVLIVPGLIRTSMTSSLPLPMPGPEAVARAIARAIERPRRRIVVPWFYLPLTYAAKLVPWLVDWVISSDRYQNLDRNRRRRS